MPKSKKRVPRTHKRPALSPIARALSILAREADRNDAPIIAEAQAAWTSDVLRELANRNVEPPARDVTSAAERGKTPIANTNVTTVETKDAAGSGSIDR